MLYDELYLVKMTELIDKVLSLFDIIHHTKFLTSNS
jgi:hypothetical protein